MSRVGFNIKDINEKKSELEEIKELVFEVEEQSKADEIFNELEDYDTKTLEQHRPKRINIEKPFLALQIKDDLELEFVQSLIIKSDEEMCDYSIEICVESEDAYLPIGYINLTFEIVKELLMYNNSFILKLVNAKVIKVLDAGDILLLP